VNHLQPVVEVPARGEKMTREESGAGQELLQPGAGASAARPGICLHRRFVPMIAAAVLLTSGCQAAAPGVEMAPETRQPAVTTDVVYGHKDGLALTFDVYRPAKPHGAAVISILSGGWRSSWDLLQQFVESAEGGLRPMTADEAETALGQFVAHSYASLLDRGFTVFAVRHGSSPRYGMADIVADVRRSVRFIRYHAPDYGVDAERLGVWGGSAGGHLSLLLGTTAEPGDPDAEDAFLREPARVDAVVAYFPPTDLVRWATAQRRGAFPAVALTEEEARTYSPIRFASADAAPSLILHGDADALVPIVEGETMHQALSESGAIAQFIRIEGAGHGFAGQDAVRANAEMVRWFEQHLVAGGP
jgi:acetyl esterase/lipase